MTEKELKQLYDKLATYREDEFDISCYVHDKYCGTKVTYGIKEYTVSCNFSLDYPDVWKLYINVFLHNDVRFNLMDNSKCFIKADDPEIFKFLDQCFEKAKTMPVIIELLRKIWRGEL